MKAALHARKHGVDVRAAASVLDDSLATTFPDVDRSAEEERCVTIGLSTKQRLLEVKDPCGNLWWISQRTIDGPY